MANCIYLHATESSATPNYMVWHCDWLANEQYILSYSAKLCN